MFGRKLKWKQLKGYNDFYLKCDVLLLGAVIEKVRSSSLRNYELCPSHYFKAPGLSWDAMLKITKNKLELIPDLDMCICSLRKVHVVEFIIFLIDTANPKINI